MHAMDSDPFLNLLVLVLLLISTATSTTTRIPLSKSPNQPSTTAPWQSISLAASSSLSRARHLKRRPSPVKLPTYPRSYGGYSVILSLGTPPQPVSLVMDTGSSLVWTPCSTPRAAYSCLNCSFSGMDPTHIPIYTPNTSSTVRSIPCQSPKCKWVFGSGLTCPKQGQHCPQYELQYGLGATLGTVLSDTLGLVSTTKKRGDTVPNFLFGCSHSSDRQPEGIAGFGRGLTSIPAQLGLTKFSYCLVSHQFDESSKTGDLVLYKEATTTHGVSYAPFRKSPDVAPYSDYYYISLSQFIVGANIVQILSRYLVPSAEGKGGVIADSGSTFTYMERAIFEPVAKELEKQMSKLKRVKEVEIESGLGPCYNVTGEGDVEVPKLVLVFTGGARMDLPLADYFTFVGGSTIVCMTALTDPVGPAAVSGVPAGPAMILGNYQQMNFYVEYDLRRQRFGFKPQQCDHHARN